MGPSGPDRPGCFYRPTVITNISPAARVTTEEVFGPVALLYRVADADAALALANDSEFGLGSSVWTTDPDEQQRFVTGLQAGQVFVKQDATVSSRPQYPRIAGYGASPGAWTTAASAFWPAKNAPKLAAVE